MIPFLDQEHRGQSPDARPTRAALVQVVIRDTKSAANNLIELLVDIDHASVLRKEHLVGKHSYIDSEYMQSVEKACISDPKVQEEIRKLNLPAEATVVVEAWAYATDGMNDMSERTTMVRDNGFTPRNQSRGLMYGYSAGSTCASSITRMPTTTLIRLISALRFLSISR